MIETIQIEGPSGKISAELLLPEAFDKAHGRCGLVMLMHGFLGSKRGALHLIRWTGHLFLFCRHLVRRLILAFLSSVRCACR